jgi:hypothetical protein
MDKKTDAKKQTPKRVTKSIRLTHSEAEELARLVEGTAYAEAALMRQWVLDGMRQFRVREAIHAYQEGQVALRGAAELAKLPVAVLLEEMTALKVAVLEDPDTFGPGLDALRQTFGTAENPKTEVVQTPILPRQKT